MRPLLTTRGDLLRRPRHSLLSSCFEQVPRPYVSVYDSRLGPRPFYESCYLSMPLISFILCLYDTCCYVFRTLHVSSQQPHKQHRKHLNVAPNLPKIVINLKQGQDLLLADNLAILMQNLEKVSAYLVLGPQDYQEVYRTLVPTSVWSRRNGIPTLD